MKSFAKVLLHPGKERSVRLRHPWVFSGAIKKIDEGVSEGDVVEVMSSEGQYLASGHFHEGSIKVRIFSFERTDFSSQFWLEKLGAALNLRHTLGLPAKATNTYRLVHAEGDGLPGLIIDIYHQTAVIQTHTIGMYNAIDDIAGALSELPGLNLLTIYDKSDDAMHRQTLAKVKNRFIKGDQHDGIVIENGISFYVNWVEGQKTGFFLDQRENRKLLQRYVQGKKVLNTFSYSGGFSMYSIAAGASLVHSVDSSKRAMEWSSKNEELNNASGRHEFFLADAFDHLKSNSLFYDVIVLDPPAFAKHLSSVKKASIGYRNLNTEGFRHVSKGGILFTFSCSQVMDKELFRKVVFQAAAQSGRNVRILHQLSQGPDHPVSIYHPEGEYLKGLVLYVD